MADSNPYYLHEENQMNEYNRQEARYINPNPQTQNNKDVHDQFVRDNGIVNNNPNPIIVNPPYPNVYQNSQIGYQPPSYPPVAYPPYQSNPQYMSYPPAPQYPINSVPSYQEYEQNSFNNPNMQGFVDHCPYCNKMTRSITEQKFCRIAWLISCVLLMATIVLFWLPFCFSCCKERHIKCTECRRTKFVIKNDC